MKPLQMFFVLSLVFMASSSSAQTNTASLEFTLNSTPVVSQFGEFESLAADTVRGSIQNLTTDSVYFTVHRMGAMQWILHAYIDGIYNRWAEDTIGIGPSETLPVMIQFIPYPTGPDTEKACITATTASGDTAESCVLTYTIAQSRVTNMTRPSNIFLMPNPASQYITLSGLNSSESLINYQVISVIGQEMTQGSLGSGSEIDLHDVPDGTYWLLLLQSARVIEEKAFTVLH
ncbi:MAG TPA: hypothetical protein VGM92_14495 [Candidatus Kapabacteria bacterium]|jgi:citrate lyase gamma subunit